jgi:hypothetical protein
MGAFPRSHRIAVAPFRTRNAGGCLLALQLARARAGARAIFCWEDIFLSVLLHLIAFNGN